MDNLPEEILIFILKNYLTIQEILRCRLVNKKFNFIARNIKLDSLVIDNHPDYYARWFYTNAPLNLLHRLRILNDLKEKNKNNEELKEIRPINGGYYLRSIEFLLNQRIFTNIKQLYIDSFWLNFEDKIGHLISQFKQLKDLSILSSLLIGKKECKFDLPNLVNLCFVHFYLYDFDNLAIFDCPRLENVQITALHPNQIDIEKIVFKNCERVKYLHFSEPWKNLLMGFKNLEKLICDNLYECRDEVVFKLGKLKEFHFFTTDKNMLNDLASKKARNNRKNLKLYFLGLDYLKEGYISDDIFEPLTKCYEGDEINCLDEKTIKFYGTYYDKLLSLPDFSHLDYNCLEEFFGKSSPKCFKDKIENIISIIVNKEIKYPDQLKELLGACKEDIDLSFTTSYLNQKLFDFLLESTKSVRSLNIFEENELTFNGLIKLEKIRSFQTDQIIEIEFLKELIRSYKRLSLKMLECKLNIKTQYQFDKLSISFNEKIYGYYWNKGEKKIFEFDKVEELISKLEELSNELDRSS